MRVRTSVALVLSLACAGTAVAQTKVDKSFTATSKDCSGIQWSEQAVQMYPTIASACQGVEVRDGVTYVKFEGTVQKNVDNGKQLVVRFKDGGDMTLTPGPHVTVYIDNKVTPVSKLSRGDELNFHVREDRFAAQFPQDASPTPQYVAVPIVYRETSSTYEPEQTAALPSTASNDALALVLGSILALFGSVMVFRRRNQN
jgi:LPXTG-motif cell wall-anchored protein